MNWVDGMNEFSLDPSSQFINSIRSSGRGGYEGVIKRGSRKLKKGEERWCGLMRVLLVGVLCGCVCHSNAATIRIVGKKCVLVSL